MISPRLCCVLRPSRVATGVPSCLEVSRALDSQFSTSVVTSPEAELVTMDMSGMGMSGGMDMSSEGPFRPTNMKIAHGYWYGIVGVVGLLVLVRLVGIWESHKRRKLYQGDQNAVPSRPLGLISQTYATASATLRELAYPQPVYFTGRFSRFFSPLPVGRWLVLVFYWIVLLCFLWTNTILTPSSPMYAYKWEIVGEFRRGHGEDGLRQRWATTANTNTVARS